MTSDHAPRRDRISHRRTSSPTAIPALVTVARLGWVAKGVVYRVARPARRADRPRRARAASGAGSGEARPARPAPSPRSPSTSFGDAGAVGRRHRARCSTCLAADLDRPAGREHGQGVAHPRRLPRQRRRVLAAGVDGGVVRPPPSRPTGSRERGRQGRALHPRPDGEDGRALAGRRARRRAHRRRPLLRASRALRATFRDELEPGGVGPFSHEAIVAARPGRLGRAAGS